MGNEAGKMVVLHQHSGSTIDHFLRAPALRSQLDLVEIDSSRHPDSASWKVLLSARHIVVVRYLPGPWLGSLRQVVRLGHRLTYVMDDDLLDPRVLQGLPGTYVNRVKDRITRRAKKIPALFDAIWVTSKHLKEKYADLQPVLLPLCPVASLLSPLPRIQLAYLGTAVHHQEFQWLAQLLERLQSQRSDCFIDVFGDLSINRLFRSIPRVRIIHPMNWQGYLLETRSRKIDLMLCPLLDHPFNAARAPVKFFDAARLGAVGLYSNRPPYSPFIIDGHDGVLLANDLTTWLITIQDLIDDPERRNRIVKHTQSRADQLCNQVIMLPFE